MALGFQNESAGRVSMVNYLQVVFVFITDIILFGKNPTVVDYLGTTLIIFFNTINGIYKAMKRNEKLEKYKFGINKKEKDSNEKKQYL